MEQSIDDFKADLKALIDKHNITLKEHDLYVNDEYYGFYYIIAINGIDTGNTIEEFVGFL